ncbi:hypothetical protein OH77DRAFT_658763 [Trametes cingulata]|nr:hypothetical protein OH77DRAFT_658763 [Trametes cingulata]
MMRDSPVPIDEERCATCSRVSPRECCVGIRYHRVLNFHIWVDAKRMSTSTQRNESWEVDARRASSDRQRARCGGATKCLRFSFMVTTWRHSAIRIESRSSHRPTTFLDDERLGCLGLRRIGPTSASITASLTVVFSRRHLPTELQCYSTSTAAFWLIRSTGRLDGMCAGPSLSRRPGCRKVPGDERLLELLWCTPRAILRITCGARWSAARPSAVQRILH